MSQAIQNRFTKTAFDAAQSVYIGEGKLLTARYSCKGRTWCAELQWKPGYERQQTSLTTLDEPAMKSALLRLDSTVRFIGKVNTAPVAPVQTLADKTDEMLEALRTDPDTSQKAYESACRLYKQKPKQRNAPAEVRTQSGGPDLAFKDAEALEALRVDITRTSDIAYRNACAKFGVPPRTRPARPVLTASQTLVPFHVQGAAYGAFMQVHGELFVGVFAEQNATVIAQWMHDENRQCDAASLAQCYAECLAAGYFRDARTLYRGIDNSLRVVRPYNYAELVAARRQQAVAATTVPPANWSDVDKEAWMAVRRDHSSLGVNSKAFQLCVRDTVQKWAFDYVIEQRPDLGADNKRAELAAAADKVLAAWVRNSNPNLRIGGPGSRINLD